MSYETKAPMDAFPTPINFSVMIFNFAHTVDIIYLQIADFLLGLVENHEIIWLLLTYNKLSAKAAFSRHFTVCYPL